MSTFTTASATLLAAVATQYDAASAELAASGGLCSADALAMADEFAALPAGEAIDFDGVRARLEEVMPSLPVLPDGPDLLALHAAGERPDALRAALEQVAESLAARERLVVADSSADVLASLGYDLIRVDGERTSAIEARRDHETFLVVVGPQGSVTTDHAGLADDTCTDRQLEYVEGMARRGVLFDDEVVVRHHDPRGGSPIANATGHESLAAGAVAFADAHRAPLVGSLLSSRRAAARRATTGSVR